MHHATTWVAIGEAYPGFQVQLWTNYPRALLADLNQWEDAALRWRTLSQIVVATNGWVDYDGSPLPPTSSTTFWDAIPEELTAAVHAIINGEAEHAAVLTEREQNGLKVWLRASDKRGLKVPWKYVRHQFAERWNIPPWLIDESPIGEIELEAQIANIEATTAPPRGEHT